MASRNEITNEINKWIDNKIKNGKYKNKNEIIKKILWERMLFEKYPHTMASQKVLEKVWDNEEDSVWESYL